MKIKRYGIVFLLFIVLCLNGCEKNNGNNEKEGLIEETGQNVSVEIENIEDLDTETSAVEDAPVSDKNPIKVAVVGSVSEDLLKEANKELSFSDHTIEVIRCEDYDRPNELVLSGEADASLYENEVYLETYNKKNATELVIAERSYFEPLALYGGKITDLNDINNSDTVAIPSGDINMARSLYLLQQKGLIELKEGASYQASAEDIVSNPHNLRFESYSIEDGFPDSEKYSLIICDHNRAMLKGIDPAQALGEENRNSELLDMFSICLVTAKDRLTSPKIKELSKALNSDYVEDHIAGTYHNSVVDYR
ncbi:MAG: hypothetical protein K5877_05105 [Lachnospiraceae bacterium]|nr:hypothetical protein [Lachnospiraceae bacterium]